MSIRNKLLTSPWPSFMVAASIPCGIYYCSTSDWWKSHFWPPSWQYEERVAEEKRLAQFEHPRLQKIYENVYNVPPRHKTGK